MQHQENEVLRQTQQKPARCLSSCHTGGDQTEESARPQKMVMSYLAPPPFSKLNWLFLTSEANLRSSSGETLLSSLFGFYLWITDSAIKIS